MLKKLTFTIYFDRGYGVESFAEAVNATLPSRVELVRLRGYTIPAILPVKFKLEGELNAFVEFSDELGPDEESW